MGNEDKLLHLEMKINQVAADHLIAKEKWSKELHRIVKEYEKGGITAEALEKMILANRREYNSALNKLIRRFDGYMHRYEELKNETAQMGNDIQML